jgi:hypothetical protein
MTPQPLTDTSATYTPDSQDRRRRRRPDDDRQEWWRPLARPTEIALGVSLLMGALSLLGFRRESPATAIAAITKTVDSLGRRADRSDSTLVKLTDRLTFTNYMLCIQAKNSPTPLGAKASTDCDAIIQQRLAP